MARAVKNYDNYWPQVFIALAQVTFAAAWALLFLPLDTSKVVTIVANILISVILILTGDLIRRRR